MANHRKQTILVNTFGTFGYISCLFLWMWVTILYLPLLLDNRQVMKILIPSGEKALPVPEPLAPSPFLMIFALAVTAIIMGVTVFVLLRAPITIAKTGKAVTTKAARSLEPLATHGKPLPPKEKRKLTATLIKFIKLLLVLVPVGVGLFTFSIPIELPYEIVIIVCGVLAALSVFWFSAQYIFAAILGVKPEKLV